MVVFKSEAMVGSEDPSINESGGPDGTAAFVNWYAPEDSNLYPWLRRPVLYPLN